MTAVLLEVGPRGLVLIAAAGLLALAAVAAVVFILGAGLSETFGTGDSIGETIGFGILGTLVMLTGVFLLVRFVKWAWLFTF